MSICLYLSSIVETFWAMIISYAVGTSMSPRVYKFFHSYLSEFNNGIDF